MIFALGSFSTATGFFNNYVASPDARNAHQLLSRFFYRFIIHSIMKTFGWNIALSGVVLLACPLGFSGKCSKQVVFFNAVGQNFVVRRNIQAKDLNVVVDGKRTQVLSLTLNSSPRRIILMVDTSASMHPSERKRGWGIALRTAAFAFDSLPRTASVALLTFGGKIQGQEDGFRPPSEVAQTVLDLAKLEPQGPTALLDSIDHALSLFQPPQLGDAIYLVTDGVDSKSKVAFERLRKELITRGIRVFLFLVPIEGYVPTGEQEAQSLVEDLTGYTGGYLIRIPWDEIGIDKQRVATVVTQISSQVESMYQVELDLANVADFKGRVKVGLAGQKHPNETLAYPRQLVPCAPAP